MSNGKWVEKDYGSMPGQGEVNEGSMSLMEIIVLLFYLYT
jgi:hypothetical protein